MANIKREDVILINKGKRNDNLLITLKYTSLTLYLYIGIPIFKASSKAQLWWLWRAYYLSILQ
jgi:hypothetical protein